MPTQVHPWIGLCTYHFNSWQRSMVHFQSVSPENRELTWCSWMYSKPPDRCLEKNRHSVNIVKHINKVPISVHVNLIFPVTQTKLRDHHCPPSLDCLSHMGPFGPSQCQCPSSPLTSTIATVQTGLFIPALPLARACFECYQRVLSEAH